jgi:hypothetical protein
MRWILFSFIFISPMLRAQIPLAYFEQAAQSNSGLKVKFNDYLAVLQKQNQMGALPDPELAFGIFITPMERVMGRQIADFSVMQMFPWKGTNMAAKEEAGHMARAKFEVFREAKSMLFLDLKMTWLEYYLLEKQKMNIAESLEILATLESLVLQKMSSDNTQSTELIQREAGKPKSMDQMDAPSKDKSMQSSSSGSAYIEILQIQMQRNELENELAVLEAQKTFLQIKWEAFFNSSAPELVVTTELQEPELPISLLDFNEELMSNNPMLLMYREEEKSLMAKEKMNKNMGYPMIGLGLQYSVFSPSEMAFMEEDMNGRNMLMPMFKVTLPIWRKKIDAAVKEAQIMKTSMAYQYEETANQLKVEYARSMNQFLNAKKSIHLYQQQIMLNIQAKDIVLVQYAHGSASLDQVFSIMQKLVNYQFQLSSAVVDAQIATAMMEKILGR